jgi:hypothetical protein
MTTTIQEATTASGTAMRAVDRVSRALGRFSRRGFLMQTAVVGSALAVDPVGYVLKPQTAAATVGCGPAASCSAGYTVMCCTINGGKNACPPGTFAAGWWKAADSSWCCGGYRYITDCNATCSKCTSGCSDDNICSSSCWSCSCKCGPTSSCDQRKVCCNAFRYGQCNTQVKCSGGVACRVVSCVAPYQFANCTTTSLSDNATAEHNAPCLEGCGPILRFYNSLGANGSPLGASLGTERVVGDARGGSYCNYEHGAISYSSTTHAHSVYGYAFTKWVEYGRERGELGYPVAEKSVTSSRWIQYFEKGLITDTSTTTTAVLVGWPYTRWKQLGGTASPLGYPTSNKIGGDTWVQYFDKGAMGDTPTSSTSTVVGWPFTRWKQLGAQAVLGVPTSDRIGTDSWVQHFEHAVMADTPASATTIVTGAIRERWLADGAQTGRWGYPVADAVTAGDGTVSQQFQGGLITA